MILQVTAEQMKNCGKEEEATDGEESESTGETRVVVWKSVLLSVHFGPRSLVLLLYIR